MVAIKFNGRIFELSKRNGGFMATLRFEVSEEVKAKLDEIRGHMLKAPYSSDLFAKAVIAEHKKQQQKKGG